MKASCDINYCVVDTIIDNGHLQFFWDRKYHFFLVRDNLHLEVMGVDFMNKLYDYELMEKGNWYDINNMNIIFLVIKRMGKKQSGWLKLIFLNGQNTLLDFWLEDSFLWM